MKNTVKKIIPLILSIVVVFSSIGYTTSFAFDENSVHVKLPFDISSTLFSSDKKEQGNASAELRIKEAQMLKNASSSGKKTTDSAGFFSKIVDFFKNMINRIKSGFGAETKKTTTTKKTTAKKTTTTTKKTTAKKTTTTTKKTTTTTKKTTATTKKAVTTTKKITTTTTKKTTATTSVRKEAVINDAAFLNEAMGLYNKARKSAGLSALKADSGMSKAAAVRAKEISKSFSHTRPDGRKSYTVYADCGLTKPSAVAENIAAAKRFDNASDIANLWLSSSDHRANIVSSKYTRFGMAWYINGNGQEYAVLMLAN